jgi:hypothetical protein
MSIQTEHTNNNDLEKYTQRDDEHVNEELVVQEIVTNKDRK